MATPSAIVVLGAGGLVGQALIKRPNIVGVARGALDLTVVDNLKSLPGPIEHSTVIMAASSGPVRSDKDAAYQQNLRMLDPLMASDPAFVVYLSTDAVYPYDTVITEAVAPDPHSAYARMHLHRERCLLEHFNDRLLIVRLTQIYGTQDRHNAYGPMRMLRQAMAGQAISLSGEGEERRDHLHVDDAAGAISSFAQLRQPGLVNLATGRSVSFAEVASHIVDLVPVPIETDIRQQPVTHRDIDITRLNELIPDFAPRSLATGLASVYEELKNRV